jgi:NTE family protein
MSELTMQRDATPLAAAESAEDAAALVRGTPDGAPPVTVSLALGSGGARGLAHIGVIEWLVEHGYAIRSIAGSSIGALIGGIYAARKLDVYADWVLTLERAQVLRLCDPAFARGGLFKGERVMGVLRELIGEHRIEALPVPFTAVALDLASKQEVWLREGMLFDAIRASIATPLIFTPLRRGDRVLVDGALINPLPLAPMLHDGTDLTVAVDLHGPAAPQGRACAAAGAGLEQAFKDSVQRFLETHLERVSEASVRWLTELAFASMAVAAPAHAALHRPDVTVQVPRNACSPHEFWRARELIDLGRACAAQAFAARVG